jgi:hypothetical protein
MSHCNSIAKIPPIDKIIQVLSSSQEDIVNKMRHLFYARHYGGQEAVDALKIAAVHTSVLLAYVFLFLNETC